MLTPFYVDAARRRLRRRPMPLDAVFVDVAYADAFGSDMSEDREEPVGERARRFFDQFPPFDSDVLGSLRSPSDVKYNPELGFDLERALAVYHDWRQHLDRIERAILAHSIVAETPPFLTAVKTALAAELERARRGVLEAVLVLHPSDIAPRTLPLALARPSANPRHLLLGVHLSDRAQSVV